MKGVFMGDLSAADVLAMTKENGNGFLEGNGIIILLLFLLFLGGGFVVSAVIQMLQHRAQ